MRGFFIAGIGASAGGLEALELFFRNMPENSGMAFVVVQHLDPNSASMMPELLQRATRMQVLQASDGLAVAPDHIYVIPENRSLSILNGTLHLFEPIEARGLRLPIDFFLRSLAADRQENSIGIILSGMGSDGSLGIKAIKEKNGIVMIQEPKTAKFDGMPVSAAQAVIADIVAPVEELPARLIEFLKLAPPARSEDEINIADQNCLDKIVILLREQTGHDFSMYKKNTLLRRIERRKGLHLIAGIKDYVRLLMENPKEIEILCKDLLIGVTCFFRDNDTWSSLKKHALLEMLKKFPAGQTLRAWVTACSTGEEAYSLAIAFKETLQQIKPARNLKLQIFASDIDADAIETARKGLYPPNIEADVLPARLNHFFTREGENYRVNSNIREMVVFATHDLIKDPPFTKVDILTCRNLLIYMEPELQNKLFALFHYAINPGGILLLGSAETIGNKGDGFSAIDSKFRIFRHTSASQTGQLVDFPSAFSLKRPLALLQPPQSRSIENIQSSAESVLLERFTPASVLVNSSGDILYINGRTGKYLEPASGRSNWNIHAMARDGLRQELPRAFRKAMQSFEPVKISSVKIGSNGGTQLADVTIQRLQSPEAIQGMIMLVFNDVAFKADSGNRTEKRIPAGAARQKELENELQRSYEDMQSMREEMQTSQEELKATNEELQSSNEELQSTNEELVTSKEEMQSLNEELQTVNAELQNRISNFIQASNDMNNLLNSTEIATIFLDKELKIRRFTDSAASIIKLRPTDAGRPFTDLASDLHYPEIESHAHGVLKTLNTFEKTIPAKNSRWFNIRIMAYRTSDDRIDGLVMTFTDVTAAKKIEEDLKEAHRALKKAKTRK